MRIIYPLAAALLGLVVGVTTAHARSLAGNMPVALSSSATRTETLRIPVDAQTSHLVVRLKRQTSTNQVVWPRDAIVRVTLVLLIDGQEYRASAAWGGGVRVRRDGTEQAMNVLSYRPPYGQVPDVGYTRLAETAKTAATGQVLIELVRGPPVTTELVDFATVVAPVPVIRVHHSVSYDNDAEACVEPIASPGTQTFALAIANNADRHIIVGAIGADGNTDRALPSGVTYNGVALTALGDEIDPSPYGRSSLWGLVAPATGTNNVVVTWPEVLAEFGDIGCANALSSFGVDQTTPTAGYVDAEASSSTTITVNVSAATGDLVYEVAYYEAGSPSATVGAGQTQRVNQSIGAGFARFLASTEAGAVTTTMSWSVNSGTWVQSAIAIKQSGGAAPAAPRRSLLGVGR